jgi:hypothetical protein
MKRSETVSRPEFEKHRKQLFYMTKRRNQMKSNALLTIALIGVVSLFGVGAAAQHEEHHPDSQATQPNSQTPTQPGTAGSGMMGGGMMGMMNMMTGQNQQMSDNMSKMMENMAAMQKEKDPAKMKSMMAKQSAMLEQMRGQMMQQGGMMQNMSGMMTKSCPTTDDAKPSTK